MLYLYGISEILSSPHRRSSIKPLKRGEQHTWPSWKEKKNDVEGRTLRAAFEVARVRLMKLQNFYIRSSLGRVKKAVCDFLPCFFFVRSFIVKRTGQFDKVVRV